MGTSMTMGTFVVTGVWLSRVYETSSFMDIAKVVGRLFDCESLVSGVNSLY
jgi:hypothetical protein